MKNITSIIILTLVLAISNSVFAKVETDTITTWRLFKDSELLISSNYYSSNIYTVEIGISEEYENLSVSVFYDHHNTIIDRSIKFIIDDETISEFKESNYSRSSFKLPKKEIDNIAKGVPNKPIAIVYSDTVTEKLILIGLIIFKKE